MVPFVQIQYVSLYHVPEKFEVLMNPPLMLCFPSSLSSHLVKHGPQHAY